MEQTEEMMILKSDIAIVVKKDGTTLIQNTDIQTFVKLYEGIAEWLKKADPKQLAVFCLSELVGRPVIQAALKKKCAEMEDRQRNGG